MALDLRFGALIEPLTGSRWDRRAIIARLAARIGYLRNQDMALGDRVFIHYGNSLGFFVDLLAAWWLGACVVPIDARLTTFEVEVLARAARPRFSLIDEAVGQDLRTRLSGADVVLLHKEESTASAEPELPPSPVGFDDPALILFTSGTTGDPKGVVHSHRSLTARWALLHQALGIEAYRRTLLLLPTHFGHGLVSASLFQWLYGADLYVLPPFRADTTTELGRLIDEHAITFLSSVPTLWTLALRMARPPRAGSLRRVHCGSAPLAKHMWRDIQAWTATPEVLNTYGLTETGSWVAGTTISDFTPEDGLIGKGWGTTFKILKAGAGELPVAAADACAPGEPGHVFLSTPALMTGYFERPDLTAKVVSQGWLKTGDIGLLDERGYLYLRGREREEINKGGMKVYPSDIDSVAGQFPAVDDVCTFAVEDPLYGQDVGIALVINDASDKALAEFRAFMAARLAKHQLPVQWYVMDAIPRTSRGKINREHVAKACAGSARHIFKNTSS
jgi:acyl-CoA synthetase (AMP-forming)/AMP-acid ligase II